MRHLIVSFATLIMCSCAIPKQHVAPISTAAVQGSVNSARKSNDRALSYNDRIDAKSAVIHKYWDTAK